MSRIPIPTLQRHPHKSGIGGAEYHFDTMIMKQGDKNLGVDHLRDISHFSGSSIHEHVHWIQHNATTIGAFLTSLRYAQYATLIRFIATFPPKIRRFLIEKYRKGHPLLHIDERTYDLHQLNEFLSGKEFTELG